MWPVESESHLCSVGSPEHTQRLDEGGSVSESGFSRWRSQIWGKMSGPFSRVSIMGIYPLLAY